MTGGAVAAGVVATVVVTDGTVAGGAVTGGAATAQVPVRAGSRVAAEGGWGDR